MKLEGGCICGDARYTVELPPLVTHCCHCRDCQRVTGSAFALNLWIERSRVVLHSGELASERVPTESGKRSEHLFCVKCGTHLWTDYHGAPRGTIFLRGGTLDDATGIEPDVHIFTRSKHPWIELPEGVPSYENYYRIKEVWSAESLARLRALREAS